MYQEQEGNPEGQGIIERLYALVCVADLNHPDQEAWGKEIERQWKRSQRSMNSIGSSLPQVLSSLTKEANADNPPRISAAPHFAANQTIKNSKKIGRNAPLPLRQWQQVQKMLPASKVVFPSTHCNLQKWQCGLNKVARPWKTIKPCDIMRVGN